MSENQLVREYCEREQFEASCPLWSSSSSSLSSSSSSSLFSPYEEVLVIRRAVYGRMKAGRCVEAKYGSIGCQIDVSSQLHARCSGRPSCKFQTSELQNSNPCPSELVAYLEVTYTCVQTVACEKESCTSGGHLAIQAATGHLSSHTSSTRGCGTASCPWRLTPKNGQHFNLTFISFASSLSTSPSDTAVLGGVRRSGKICQCLAKVLDRQSGIEKDATICSDRFSPPYHVNIETAESAAIEIHMLSTLQHSHLSVFIVIFETLGCEEFVPPLGGWFKRSGNHVDIGCRPNQKLWRLHCQSNRWVGEVKSCEEAASAKNDAWNADGGGLNLGSTGSMQGLLVVVGVGIVLGIILGFSMLTIAVVMLRKRNRKTSTKISKNEVGIYQHPLHGECPMNYGQSTNMRQHSDNLYGASYAPIADLLLSNHAPGSPYKSLTTVLNDGSYDSTLSIPQSHHMFHPCHLHRPPSAAARHQSGLRQPLKNESSINRTTKETSQDSCDVILPPPPPPPPQTFEAS